MLQFPDLQNGDHNSTYALGIPAALPPRVNEMMLVKHSAWHTVGSQYLEAIIIIAIIISVLIWQIFETLILYKVPTTSLAQLDYVKGIFLWGRHAQSENTGFADYLLPVMLKDMPRLKSPHQPAANWAFLSLSTKCWTAFCNVIKITLKSESSITPSFDHLFLCQQDLRARLHLPLQIITWPPAISLISVFILLGASIQYFFWICVFIVCTDVKNYILIFWKNTFWCEND